MKMPLAFVKEEKLVLQFGQGNTQNCFFFFIAFLNKSTFTDKIVISSIQHTI